MNEALRLLQRHQWAAWEPDRQEKLCPECCGTEAKGHTDTCALARVLSQAGLYVRWRNGGWLGHTTAMAKSLYEATP